MDEIKELLEKVKKLNEEKAYDQVIGLLPDEKLEELKHAKLWAEKAQALWRTDRYEDSGKAADRALALDDKCVKAYNYKGNYYRHIKEYDKAIEFFEKALQYDPEYAPAYDGLGAAYDDLNDYDKAIEFYEKALQYDPKYASAYNNLGACYSGLNDHEKAIEFYEKALQYDPEYADAYNNLGAVYYRVNNYEKAIEFFKKALKYNPELVQVYNNLAIVYKELKEYDKALEYYNRLEIDRKNINIHYNLALLLILMGRLKESAANFSKYIEKADSSDPYLKIAKFHLQEIENRLKNTTLNEITKSVDKIKALLSYTEGNVTHYTGLKVSNLIIRKNSAFRLSEGAYLNDTSEGTTLLKYLGLRNYADLQAGTLAVRFVEKPFIGSFVADIKHDDLTLWRMYGKEDKEDGKGCALTINMNKFLEGFKKKNNMNDASPGKATSSLEDMCFYRVAYLDSSGSDKFIIPDADENTVNNLNEMVRELRANIEQAKNEFGNKPEAEVSQEDKDIVQQIIEELNEVAFLFKGPEYRYENEVRLVVNDITLKKEVDDAFDPPKTYIETIPLRSIIEKVTIGPKVEKAEEWAAAFHYDLAEDDLSPEILISRLPYK